MSRILRGFGASAAKLWRPRAVETRRARTEEAGLLAQEKEEEEAAGGCCCCSAAAESPLDEGAEEAVGRGYDRERERDEG